MSSKETATFAAGCFWCTEAIFRRLKGVTSVMPGYTGGKMENPNYEEVSSGKTGHAEAVQIEFDPKVISFEKLLDVFWHLHDPTQLDRQGADVGTQYRSAIFYHDEKQKELAEKSKEKLEKSGYYNDPIVTKIVPFEEFYPAEKYHKDFYETHKNYPYCKVVIDPKIKKLMTEYKDEVKGDLP